MILVVNYCCLFCSLISLYRFLNVFIDRRSTVGRLSVKCKYYLGRARTIYIYIKRAGHIIIVPLYEALVLP